MPGEKEKLQAKLRTLTALERNVLRQLSERGALTSNGIWEGIVNRISVECSNVSNFDKLYAGHVTIGKTIHENVKYHSPEELIEKSTKLTKEIFTTISSEFIIRIGKEIWKINHDPTLTQSERTRQIRSKFSEAGFSFPAPLSVSKSLIYLIKIGLVECRDNHPGKLYHLAVNIAEEFPGFDFNLPISENKK